jgi:large conductance mechanosensitive channel
MSLISEFKAFAVRGNVIDLAVGVVIGGSFGKIIGALVDQVIMPPIGLVTGGVDFSSIKVVLQSAAAGKPEVALGIGVFINTLVQFTIVAFSIFMVVRAVNAMTRKQAAEKPPAPAPTPSAEAALLVEIRDLLKLRT